MTKVTRCVRDWTALPTELLECIANRLPPSIEDYNAFRGVCTSWRGVDVKFAPVVKVPFLMLAENDGSNEREFYSLAKGRIGMRIPFPKVTGKRCINVGFGWILTLSSLGDVCLLKPFSPETSVIQLPNINTFPRYRFMRKFVLCPEFRLIRGALLTGDPSETLDFKVIVFMGGFLGFCSIFNAWTRIAPNGYGMLYCKELGKLYTLDLSSHVLIWDPQGTDLSKPQEQVKVDNVPTFTNYRCMRYLVKSTFGELLMIERNNTDFMEYSATGVDYFKVMRVDLVKGECKEINDVGKDAIFVGDHTAVSVDAAKSSGVLKPNSIYFMDDCIYAYTYNPNRHPQRWW